MLAAALVAGQTLSQDGCGSGGKRKRRHAIAQHGHQRPAWPLAMTAVIRNIASCAQPSSGPRCPPNAISSGVMSGTPPSARAPGSSRKIVLPSFTVSVTLMSAMVVGSTAVGSFDRMRSRPACRAPGCPSSSPRSGGRPARSSSPSRR